MAQIMLRFFGNEKDARSEKCSEPVLPYDFKPKQFAKNCLTAYITLTAVEQTVREAKLALFYYCLLIYQPEHCKNIQRENSEREKKRRKNNEIDGSL